MSKVRFDEFWAAYPRRKGDRAKATAMDKFLRLVAGGMSADDLIGSARAYADANHDKIGTEFIPMASTWLNQRRWEDYAPIAAKRVEECDAILARHGYRWNGEKCIKVNTNAG